jgi:hypothetical protein
MLDYLPPATFKKIHDLLYILVVFLLGDATYAASEAFLDMELQAGTVFPSQNGIGSNLQVAGAQRIYIVEEFHEIARVHHTAVWTEIPRSVPDHPSGEKHLREIIIADAYPGIGLGILQENVVARLELLDKIVFKQQCICL